MHPSTVNPMRLVLITNAAKIKFEADTINRLFREGLDELHIRKPELDKSEHIKLIDNIDGKYHSRLVLHDCYSLVHEYDIRRIHLSRDWAGNPLMRMYLDRIVLRGIKVSKSICTSECSNLYKTNKILDEIILGPVFKKSMYIVDSQMIKTDTLTKAIRHSKLPVLGLGGVSVDTVPFFRQNGFAGVVMQSSVWAAADAIRAFADIRDAARVETQSLRIAI